MHSLSESASESHEGTGSIYLAAPFGVSFSFPGATLFWKLVANCGLDRAWFDLSGDVASTTAKVIVCFGSAHFYALTGIKISIDRSRGYLYKREDCLPIETKVWEQVGEYKSTKKIGPKPYVKGDPKYGWVKRSISSPIPESVEWIIPVLPPETVQAQALKTIPALKADLLRAKRIVEDGSGFSPDNEPFRFLPYPVGIDNPSMVGIDIETVGLTDAIERLGVCASGTVWSAQWNQNTLAAFEALLARKPLLVGHNLAFDVPRLEKALGRSLGNRFFDTMLAAHLLQPDLYKGLEKVASLYLDVRPWKHLSASEPARYNAMDVAVTFDLCHHQLEALTETGQRDLFCHTLMPALRVVIDMTRRGIRVDRKRLAAWQNTLLGEQREALRKWGELAPAINPLSPSQIAQYLYVTLGLPRQQSKTGGTTTDASALRYLLHDPRAPRLTLETLIEIKRVSKLIGTYAKVEISDDDCVHPSYVPSGKDTDNGAAATGRMASSNPNIQNQPPPAKAMFIPHVDGMVLAEFDFSQIELRIAAARSGDRALIDALKGDVHARTMDLLGVDRTRAKNLLYGTLYGAGPRKLAQVLRSRGYDTPERDCRRLQDSLARAYPDLFAWRRAVVAEGVARRFLTNSFGRRRYFYGGDGSAPAMMDFFPQSDAADILWSQLVDLDRIAAGYDGALLCAVHDSALFELWPARLPELVAAIKECMEQTYDQIAPGFSVPVHVKVGANWGELRDLSDSMNPNSVN